MKIFFIILSGLMLILTVSCSSAPQPQEQVVDLKNNAAELMGAGQRLFAQGAYNQALNNFSQALQINTAVNNIEGIINANISLAKVYLALGKKDQAEASLKEAFYLANSSSVSRYIRDCYIGMGEYSLTGKDSAKALDYFQKALAVKIDKPDDKNTARIYNNLAVTYRQMEKYDESLKNLTTALELNTKIKNYDGMAANCYTQATIYSRLKQYPKALDSADKALEYDTFIENTAGIGKDLYAIGLLYRRNDNPAKAHDFFRRSYQVYQAIGFITEIKPTLQHLIELSILLGKKDEAAAYQKSYAEYFSGEVYPPQTKQDDDSKDKSNQ